MLHYFHHGDQQLKLLLPNIIEVRDKVDYYCVLPNKINEFDHKAKLGKFGGLYISVDVGNETYLIIISIKHINRYN